MRSAPRRPTIFATMANDLPAVRAKASEIVEKMPREQPMSEADTTALIEAVAADLATGATKAKHDEERLLKVEAQTHALAEAVIAMADHGARRRHCRPGRERRDGAKNPLV